MANMSLPSILPNILVCWEVRVSGWQGGGRKKKFTPKVTSSEEHHWFQRHEATRKEVYAYSGKRQGTDGPPIAVHCCASNGQPAHTTRKYPTPLTLLFLPQTAGGNSASITV